MWNGAVYTHKLANHVATIRTTASGCRSCVSHERYVSSAATAGSAATNHSGIGWSNAVFGLDSRHTQRWLDGACDERRSSLLLQVSHQTWFVFISRPCRPHDCVQMIELAKFCNIFRWYKCMCYHHQYSIIICVDTLEIGFANSMLIDIDLTQSSGMFIKWNSISEINMVIRLTREPRELISWIKCWSRKE